MTEFKGKIEIQDSTGSNTRVKLDGDTGYIYFYRTSEHEPPRLSINIDAQGGMTFSTIMGAEGLSLGSGHIAVKNDFGEDRITVDGGGGESATIVVKNDIGQDGIKLDGRSKTVVIRDDGGKESVVLDGLNSSVVLQDRSGKSVVYLEADADRGSYGGLFLGAYGKPGKLVTRNEKQIDSIKLDGRSGEMTLFDADGHRGFALLSEAPSLDNITAMWIGASNVDSRAGAKAGYLAIRNSTGNDSLVLNGNNNSMALRDEGGANKIILDGAAGDIILANADCAEDFDILDPDRIEPGTVMVIEEGGKLQQSTIPYDKKVAGIISGAGDKKPGIILDKKKYQGSRKPVALMGKVYCKVDANFAPINVGDMLTTSSTKGYAMKALDPALSFGAVLGKALRSLKKGKGLIPILIALQ